MTQRNKLIKEITERVFTEVMKTIIKETRNDQPVSYMINGVMKKFKNAREYKNYLRQHAEELNLSNVPNRGPGRPKKGEETTKRRGRYKKGEEPEGVGSQTKPSVLASQIEYLLVNKQDLKAIRSFVIHAAGVYGSKTANAFFDVYKDEVGSNLFREYAEVYKEIWQNVKNIKEWGARNEYATYEAARRLSVALFEISDIITRLTNATQTLSQGKKLSQFNKGGQGNIIKGYGNVLGLKGLIIAQNAKKVDALTNKINEIAALLKDIAENGRDPLSYH